jgi:hypothetical protein
MLISAHLPQNLFRLLPAIPMDQEVPSTASAGRWSAWLTWIPTSIFPLGFHLQYLSIQSNPIGAPKASQCMGCQDLSPRLERQATGLAIAPLRSGGMVAFSQPFCVVIEAQCLRHWQLISQGRKWLQHNYYIYIYVIIYIYIYVYIILINIYIYMMYVTGWNLNSLKDSQSPIYKISLVLVKTPQKQCFFNRGPKNIWLCEQLGVPKFPSNLASALNYKHHKLTQVGQFSTKKLPAIWVCLKMNNLLQKSTKFFLMFPMGECSFMGSPESTSFSDKHNISYSSLYIKSQ